MDANNTSRVRSLLERMKNIADNASPPQEVPVSELSSFRDNWKNQRAVMEVSEKSSFSIDTLSMKSMKQRSKSKARRTNE